MVDFEVVADRRGDASVDLFGDAFFDALVNSFSWSLRIATLRPSDAHRIVPVRPALLERLVDVHTLDGSRTAHEQSVFFAEHNGGAVTRLDQTTGHDAQHSTVPTFAADDGAAAAGWLFRHLGQRFFCHVFVQVSARLVHGFEFVRQFVCRVVV